MFSKSCLFDVSSHKIYIQNRNLIVWELFYFPDTSKRNNGGGYGGQARFQQQRVVQYSDDDDSDSDSE